jgi:protein required for attachment to host cells
MATTWIVSGDSSRARILQVTGPDRLEEVESFDNPKGRMHNRDARGDAYPRFNGHGGVGKAGTGQSGGPGNDREEITPAEHSAEVFSRQLAEYLDKARIAHRFDRLYLVAPPKFLGFIRKELGKEVGKLVHEEIHKDFSSLNLRDLAKQINASSNTPPSA